MARVSVSPQCETCKSGLKNDWVVWLGVRGAVGGMCWQQEQALYRPLLMTPEWRRAYRTCGPAAAAILSTRHLFTSRQPSFYTQAAPLLHPANDQGAAFVSELQAAQRLALSTLLYKLVPFVSTLY